MEKKKKDCGLCKKKKKMPKPIQVLSWEMKGYLTKVVCSPELKMTKVGLLSTSCSIWSELGSEKSLLKEHTHVARRDWTFWGNNIEGGRWNKVRLFFKMHSARRGKRQVWEGKQHEWHLKDTLHVEVRSGTLVYKHTQIHTGRQGSGTGAERALRQEYIILTQPSHREPFSFLNPLFTVHH